jgi:hypothetical protein
VYVPLRIVDLPISNYRADDLKIFIAVGQKCRYIFDH